MSPAEMAGLSDSEVHQMAYSIRTLDAADWNGLDSVWAGAVVEDLVKALEAGGGVDAASYEGGRALGYESLDSMLQNVTLTEKHAALWRAIPKRPIHATVDQYTRRSAHGGRWGMAVAESSNPTERAATLARMYAEVAYYRDYRSVSDISMAVSNIVNPKEEEAQSATIQLISTIDEDLYWCNRNAYGVVSGGEVVPLALDGFYSKVYAAHNDATLPQPITINQGGAVLSSRDPFMQAAALVYNAGGRLTNAFCNPLLATDLTTVYETAERITINTGSQNSGSTYYGSEIGGINTAQGRLDFEQDPFNLTGWQYTGAVQGSSDRPAAATSVAAAAGSTGGIIPTGDYLYQVTAVNTYGESLAVDSSVVSVTLGQKVTLTITNGSAAAAATGFRIYRSAKNASDTTDCRFLWHVPITSGATTSFVDDGFWVPGTSHILLLGLDGPQPGVQWSQLLPLTRKELAQTGPTQPFLFTLSGANRVAKPEWFAVIRNVLPTYVKDGGWNPLGV